MLLTTEAVSKGHPDKFCDQVSDKVTSYMLEKTINEDYYNKGKVAIETLAKGNTIVLAGEYWLPNNEKIKDTTLKTLIDKVINDVGYDNKGYNFINLLEPQSKEIQDAVINDAEIGAGDQGMMFGYAVNNPNTNYLPVGYYNCQLLMKEYADFIKTNKNYKPDAKCQIATDDNNIKRILLSCQHTEGLSKDVIQYDLKNFIAKHIDLNDDIDIIINPSGSFVNGGYEADAGLTGRKIINDTYGGFARHGGGAFSGKDYTKVDRSGAYIARYFAKQFVLHGLMEKCEVQISYSIGLPTPFSINVNSFGTASQRTEQDCINYLENEKITPLYIFKKLKLYENPLQIYESSKHGHFTNNTFTWEQL